MTAFSTKGLTVNLTKADAAPVTKSGATEITAITSANPAVVSVDDATGIAAGSVIILKGTGLTTLDGKAFLVDSVSGTDITLGADTSGDGGTFTGATASLTSYAASDFQSICCNSISVDANQPGTVSTPTFCDPTSSLPSIINEAGNMTLAIYHDVTDLGFVAMEKAFDDSNERVLTIEWPQSQGTLIAQGTVSGWAISDIPIDGGTLWQATFALKSRPVLRY